MLKIINGKPVNLDINFWSDYLYGKELQKITLNNIYENISLEAGIKSIIDLYKTIYDCLHPIIQTMENDIKYCLLGELSKKEYYVSDKTLYIKYKNYYICFKGEYWSLTSYYKLSNYLTWQTIKEENNSIKKIFDIYIKNKGKNFIKNCFPELYNAIDGVEDKLGCELDDILTFLEVDELKSLSINNIIDLDLSVKYNLVPFIENSSNGDINTEIINLENNEVSNINSTLNFNIYKQNLLQDLSNENDISLSEESKVKNNNELNLIISALIENNVKETRGLKINNVYYFEIDDDIYTLNKNTISKIIKGGSIYGYYSDNNNMKYLLIKHTKLIDNLVKETIYLLKGQKIDIAKISFKVKENEENI